MDFSKLKANSGKKSLAQLQEMTKKASKEGYAPDERFWKPTVDKAGNGFAIIRFLPAPSQTDELAAPFVKYYDHSFQNPKNGLWYIENCRTTINEPDPCAELNTKLWNTGIEANKNRARDQKRKTHYISNILVISDPSNPSNEGKVFLFKYGEKIFGKINDAQFPKFADEVAFNPFDMWEGAPFKLKIRNENKQRNYDSSSFDDVGPISEDDEVLEKIYKSTHSLAEFIDPKNFKTYEQLRDRLAKVLGEDLGGSAKSNHEKPKAESAPILKSIEDDEVDEVDSEDDDDDAFFAGLKEKMKDM